VILPSAQYPAQQAIDAQAIRTSTRFFAIGTVGPTIRPTDQEARCAALPSARNFLHTSSEGDAALALQLLGDVRRFAREVPRMVRLTCTTHGAPCTDPLAVLDQMRPDRAVEVRRVPCASPATPEQSCLQVVFHPLPAGLGSIWSAEFRGTGRPFQVQLNQIHPPVV
jgi:hypothetical protein